MSEIDNKPSFKENEDTILQLIDLWKLFWNNKWWYVGSVAICLLIAAFQIYKLPVIYRSSAKVIIDESDQDATMRNLGVASSGMIRSRYGANAIENEMEALKSPDLMAIVVDRLGLQTKYVEKQWFREVELYQNSPIEMRLVADNPSSSFSYTVQNKGNGEVVLKNFKLAGEELGDKVKANLGDTIVTPVGALALHPTDKIDQFTNDLVISWTNAESMAFTYTAKLEIAQLNKESAVVVVSVNDNYISRATSVINTLLDVYNEEWIRNKNRSSIQTAEFINERLLVIEKELGTVEDAIKDYKSTNNLTDVKAVAASYLQESSEYAARAFDVNNQLSIAKFIKEYLNDPANAHSMIPSNLGLSSSSIEEQVGKYNGLILKRDRLITGSSENNPMISDINNTITAIRTIILRSIDNLITTLELQGDKIESQEKQIMARMASSSGQELQLLSIERQQKITQSLYMFLLEKREENELAALVNVGNTRLLVAPKGGSPVAPDKTKIILIALILGFGLPFAVFFVLKLFDTSIKTKNDLKGVQAPFLAEVPLIANVQEYDHSNRKILVRSGKRDMMNEAFRVLRTNVDLMIGKKEGSKVIMFTSFNPNEGKTFVIMNVAASMALKNAKTIIVDLDLRKATLSKSLGIKHAGVAAYLNGSADDYHQNVEQVAENLFVLPVGTLPPNPSELLLTDKFTELMDSLRKEYDYVFIDCPPIDIVADASIVTGKTDMAIFVLRSGKMDKKYLPAIQEIYESNKYKHMALVLNGIDLKHKKYGYGRYGYGYGKNYGYSYGYGEQD